MAVFDIDMTLLNNQQRYTDAKRAGVVDKDGKAKRKTRFETPGKAFKRAQDFLFDASRLEKDRLIAGAADFVNQLVEDGYIVAYCTGRRLTYYEVTRAQLEKKGFPIMKDDQDRELLFMRAGGSKTTPEYKKDVLSALNAAYDVRFFFDDLQENLAAAAQVGIPGLYLSISDYSKMLTKSNPQTFQPDLEEMEQQVSDFKKMEVEWFGKDPEEIEEEYQPDEAVLQEMREDDAALHKLDARGNPPVKPRRKKMKNGKYRKEPAKKYVDRFMGNSKMVSEFPDAGQRYAVSLGYVEKFYGKRGLDSVGARQNPEEYSENYMVPRDIHRLGKAADRLEDTYEDGQEVPEWWKSKLSVAAKDTDTLADALEYVDERGNPPNILPIYAGEPTSKFTNKGMVSAEVQIGRNLFKDIGEAVQSVYRGLIGGRTTMAEKRMAMAMASMQKELSERATAKGANAVANLKVDYEMVDQSVTITLMATADAIKMTRPPKMTGAQYRSGVKKMLEAKSNPRKNPSHSKKIEKGKKLYKHMNGKEPEKVEKKKIDMGDVWYQVGEGGCWQIGYMSGKETGNANQKYTHTFNEETQDGNFPKLYATMPENGKPLLIIQGGTWKIRTDDKGVAWIYD